MLGLAVGNYATSFVYRLPKQESSFTRHPYCDDCGTMLTPKDLFPAFSWLFLRGRCRYCGVSIPSLYFWMEIFCATLFVAALTLESMESYLLVVTAFSCIVTLWALEVQTRRIYSILMIAIVGLGMVYRTLFDGSYYPSLYGAFWGAGVPMVWWRLRQGRKDVTGKDERLVIPAYIALGAAAGTWLAPQGLAVFAGLWVAFFLLYRTACATVAPAWPKKLQTVPFSLALCTLILFPEWIPLAWQWLKGL